MRAVLHALRWWEIPQLVELEQALFAADSPWTAEMFWSELAAGNHYLVHHRGQDPSGPIDGYAGLAGVAALSGEAEVQTIGVRPDSQGRGLGRMLLTELLRLAGNRRVLLEVRTDNLPALQLYQSVGFSRIGLRRRYYHPSGADAFTMHRPAIVGEQ